MFGSSLALPSPVPANVTATTVAAILAADHDDSLRHARIRLGLDRVASSGLTRSVLSPSLTTLRLFLHVLAASVWVGGQIALAGVVPSIRGVSQEATRAAARAFARVAWPAFAVAVITGMWNLTEIAVGDRSTSYQITLFVKIVLAIASGAAAAVHAVGRTKLALAVGGALGLLGALAAMFLGVLLVTGS